MLSADYSQIELRLAAHICDVPQLKAAFDARRGHPQHDRRRAVRRGQSRHPRLAPRRSTSPSSTAFRAGAWPDALASPPTRRRRSSTAISSASRASRAISPTRCPTCARPASPPPCSAARPISRGSSPSPARAPGRRARRDQRADPGHRRRHHQAGDGADGPGARARGPRSGARMLMQVHDELVFEVPESEVEAAPAVIRARDGAAPPSRRSRSACRSASRSAPAPNWGAAH